MADDEPRGGTEAQDPTSQGAESLWGGGFKESMHPALARISHSLPQDLPLCDADLRASAAYARALGRCGVLSPQEAETLGGTLETLLADFRGGRWQPRGGEDVHTAIETEVTKRAGSLGACLHTGRSRNDQVATAFRLALSERIDGLVDAIRGLQGALIARAEAERDTLMPSYTHLQRAQPIRLAHWIMASFWPLQRDVERLRDARERVLILPLGSGAVSGHPFGLDRQWLANILGFSGVSENSLDAVGDRDFALEFAFCASLVATHLSRLAEELVIFSSSEFGYVRWPDNLATGSSLMPNKKNPDLAELVRGRAATTIGDVVALLVLIKGLPSSYQRDLQEDKPPIWRIAGNVEASLVAMTAALQGIVFGRERMQNALSDDLLATEAADLLVAKGVPFRRAHGIIAALAAQCRERNCSLKELAASQDFVAPEPLTSRDILTLEPLAAVERRQTEGGTGCQAVSAQIRKAQLLLPTPGLAR